MGFVNNFYNSKRLPKAVAATFIALLPKSANPQCLEEYMPIYIVDSLYQII